MLNTVALILISLFFVSVSIAYLRHLYAMIDFRKSLHIGDVVKYHKGRDLYNCTIVRIPNQSMVTIKPLEGKWSYPVSIENIFPL